jgi:hypothetical protein
VASRRRRPARTSAPRSPNPGYSPKSSPTSPKSTSAPVRRWLSGGIPYPRHRANIARALNTTERDLWPELAQPAPADNQATTTTAAAAADPMVGYARADDLSAPTTETLIAAAEQRIDLLDITLHRLLTRPGLTDLLGAKANAGCRIRILLTQPGDYLRPLLDVPGIELAAIDTAEPQTIHRIDEQMLITLNLIGPTDPPPPLLHIHRQTPNGLFDRIATHQDYLHQHAAEPLQTEHDIDTRLNHDDPPRTEPEPDPTAREEQDPPRAEPPTQPTEAPHGPPGTAMAPAPNLTPKTFGPAPAQGFS